MPLIEAMAHVAGPTVTERLEDRWVMSYAASVMDRNPVYFNNLDGAVLPAHPAYVSHLEWEAISALHEILDGLTPQERLRGVHSFNDTRLFRPLCSGDQISCRSSVVGIEERRSGAKLSIQTDTVNETGEVVCSSLTSTVFRGVQVDGPTIAGPTAPNSSRNWSADPIRSEPIEIDSLAAHIFSECARDYNPIHTDIRVAQEAGLPGLILHGTGTFAVVLSSLTNHEAQGDPTLVRRISGRLGAMVLCPSRVQLSVYADESDARSFRYELATDDGDKAIAEGLFVTS